MNSMSENSSPSDWAKEPYIIAAARRSSRRQRWRTRSIMALWSIDPPWVLVAGPRMCRSGDSLLLNQPLPLSEIEGVPGHLYGGGVHHLAVDADRTAPGGAGLLVSFHDLPCPLDLSLGGREDLVDDLDLGRVDAPLAVEA